MENVVAGHAVVHVLKNEGVKCVFGLPGGHILPVYDGLYDAGNAIRHVLVRHEQTAASMAAAYAQLTGEPGVCLVTAGPGATNLLTGITEAFIGALPIIIIAARGSTQTWQKGAAQEVATEQVFAPVTKWSVRVDRADLLVDVLRQAFTIARSGKPGPVYIDVPRDILALPVPLPHYTPVGKPPPPQGNPQAIKAAVDEILKAKRPIIVAGGGAVASDAQAVLREFAEMLAIPVLTSLSGRGSIADDNPLSVGGLGCHRNDLSGQLLTDADCVLGLGTRFEEMETNWKPGFIPDPSACYIQVDTDPNELGRSVVPQIGITGDVSLVLRDMIKLVRDSGKAIPKDKLAAHPRVKEIAKAVAAIEADANAIAAPRTPIHALQVVRTARKVFPRETSVAIDVGCLAQHMAGAFPFFRIFEPRSTVVCSSFYGMGFSASGLPVTKIVHPDRPAIGFVGDGSFQMMMQALPVAVEHGLPVTWCVLNDNKLGSIWDIQKHAYGERFLGTAFSYQPDFATIAKGCGCYGEKIDQPGEIEAALRRAMKANAEGKPAVLDFIVGSDRMKNTTDYYWFYQKK
jgi:acetolactate synthase-1/2/3 large subunit